MFKTRWTTPLLAVGISLAAQASAYEARVDGFGNLTALNVRGEKIPFAAKYKIVLPDWNGTESPNPWNIVERRQNRQDTSDVWTGRFQYDRADVGTSTYRHVLRNRGDCVSAITTVTPDADLPGEGLFQYFDFPTDRWIGATCTVSGTESKSVRLPDSTPENHHLLIAKGKTITLVDAKSRTKLTIQFDTERSVTVEDYRKWGDDQFTVYTCCSRGLLKSGQPITVVYEVSAELMDDPEAATVSLRVDQPLYQLDGIGGNYCFNTESPTTQYTLENLKVGWARTEMTLRDWAPTSETNGAGRAANDQAESVLRQEFELMKQIQDKGVPYVISIWNLPWWLYEDPTPEDRQARRVHPDRWDALLDCVGSYLVHAKDNYGAEPDLFSFNEADHGVKVKITAEELPGVINTWDYAVREAVMYQDLILHAWPRGTMQWEFTRDYGIVREEPNGAITPTKRFWFVKHFCNLTPQPAQVLATESNQPAVQFTAFRGNDGKLVMHLMNNDRARKVTITGLPDSLFNVTRTSATHDFTAMSSVTASDGRTSFTVPPESLTTLIGR